MAAAIFDNATRGLITIRDLLKTGFASFIGLSDDSLAFNAAQTSVNPSGGATVTLIKAATIANVDSKTFTATVSVNGNAELTGKNIYTISPCTSAAAGDAQGRVVRSLPIGVQAGDLYTVGLQIAAADNT